MKINKYIIPLFGMSMLITAVSSCSKDDVEVIEQNTAWNIDPKYEEEDIRNSIGEIPTTPLAYLKVNNSSIKGRSKDGVITLTPEVYQAEVFLTKALSYDLEVSLNIRESEAINILPSDLYTIEKAIIKANDTKGIVLIKFNLDKFSEGNILYNLPLNVTIGENKKDIAPAKEKGTLDINLSIQNILDNVELSDSNIEGTNFNQGVSFHSNSQASKLVYLNDGKSDFNAGASFWGTDAYNRLLVDLHQDMSIKGLIIHTNKQFYQLNQLSIQSKSKDDPLYDFQGRIETDLDLSNLTIKFKEPINAQFIELYGFNTNGMITEIEFIK